MILWFRNLINTHGDAQETWRCQSSSTLCETWVSGKIWETGFVGRRAGDVIYRCSYWWQLNHSVGKVSFYAVKNTWILPYGSCSFSHTLLNLSKTATSSWPILYFPSSPSMALFLPCCSLAYHSQQRRRWCSCPFSPCAIPPRVAAHAMRHQACFSKQLFLYFLLLRSGTCLSLLFKVLPICRNWHAFPLCHWENIFECQWGPPTW